MCVLVFKFFFDFFEILNLSFLGDFFYFLLIKIFFFEKYKLNKNVCYVVVFNKFLLWIRIFVINWILLICSKF